MLDALQKGFNAIIYVLNMIGGFLITIITYTGLFFKLISSGIGLAFSLVIMLPPVVQVFAVLSITVSVVYLIIGRNKSG